jgi:hypothetical protein
VDIFTPFGFSGFAGSSAIPGLEDYWRSFVRRRNYVCGYFALHPRFAIDVAREYKTTSNNLFILDLRQGLDVALARVSRSRRRTLKAWESSGNRFVDDKIALSEFIVREHEPFMQRAGASAGAFFGVSALRSFCASERVEIVGIAREGRIAAAHAFALTAWDSESLFFLGTPDARQDMPALFWEAVKRTAAKGLAYFNMGGGARENDSIALSKKLYGADAYLIQRSKEVYLTDQYVRLCRDTGVDPEDRSGYFPPYRNPA